MPTVEARITEVTRKDNGWIQIKTDHDRVKLLSTKIDQKGKEAFALQKSGEVAVIQFTSRPKTLDDGRTFDNFYYDKALAVETNGASASDDIPTAAPTTRSPTNPDDAWRISLAAGAKLAVATLPMLPTDERDLDSQLALALWWAQKLYFTSRPTEAFANRPSGVRQDEWDSPDEFASSADDDIPWD